MSKLDTDLLVINGDLYDLYISPPGEDLLQIIKQNKNIKDIVYIRGNHDFHIKEYFPLIDIRDSYEVGDILITHGHQYDFLSQAEPTGKGFGKWFVVIRNWIETIFKFNVRILLKKITFGLIDKLLFKTQVKAVESNPGKKVIIGHTHAPINKHPYYNTGCMVDEFFTYMVINMENGIGRISLIIG
jgi:predicted phosphodiesterase